MHWLSLVALAAIAGVASAGAASSKAKETETATTTTTKTKSTTTGRVLMIPSSLYPTHRWVMRELAGELVKRGHKVVWWQYGLSKSDIPLPQGVEERFWQVSVNDQTVNDLFLHKNHSSHAQIWNADFKETATQAASWLASVKLCERVLATRKGDFDLLVKEKFDTVVVDDLYNPCGLLYVGLQKSVYIYWSMTALRTESAWANQSPSPPSYIPVPGTGLTDELDFWQRSFNLASYLKAIYIHQRIVLRRVDALFQRYYPGITESFYIERNASINYVNTPPIFDFARPYMPRVNFVGGVQCHKPKPLTGNIAKFVETADNEHGFILFTTGFTVQWKYAPQNILNAFVTAFKSRTDVKFIWQYDGPAIPNLPPNVLVEKWLPQQDLLGHPKCKGLISHGGLNSVIESIWHGVPIIGLPLTAQGRDNLLRATARGAGFMLSKEHLDDKTILKAIRKIYDKTYKDEVLVFQDLITDVPYTELNHSAFWVEFIMRHQEVPHARSGADHLNILQYFLVDVLSFMFAVVFLFFTVLYYIIKFTCRGCCYVCRASYRSIAGGSTKVKVDQKKKTQ